MSNSDSDSDSHYIIFKKTKSGKRPVGIRCPDPILSTSKGTSHYIEDLYKKK